VLLGPIVLGAWLPDLHAGLFAPESLPALTSLSTLGLVLFMFIVGAELRAPDGIRAQARAAGLVGLLGMCVPMAMGLAITPLLYPALAPAGVGFWPFALFVAASLSITAFPVLARILKDRRMTQGKVGQLALLGRLRAAFARGRELNLAMQALFREWGARNDIAVATGLRPLDQYQLDWCREMNRALTDDLDDDAFVARAQRYVGWMEQLAGELLAHAHASHAGIDDRGLSNLLGPGAGGASLPEPWYAARA
jgi:hypothetical protein